MTFACGMCKSYLCCLTSYSSMTDPFMFTAEIKGGDSKFRDADKDNRKQVLRPSTSSL